MNLQLFEVELGFAILVIGFGLGLIVAAGTMWVAIQVKRKIDANAR